MAMNEAPEQDAGSSDHPGSEHAAEEQPDEAQRSRTTRYEIEIILARQLASYLAFPIVVVEPSHLVVYYNEPAELMLGRRFDEGGPIPWADWSQSFAFTDEAGQPIPINEMPVARALQDQQLAHRLFWMRGLDGVQRHMGETAIPLIRNTGRFLGVIACFTYIDE
jgi:PAS domain-containing protein